MKEVTVIAIAIIAIAAIFISMVIFAPEPDPNYSRMRSCLGVSPSDAHRLECTKLVYGEDK